MAFNFSTLSLFTRLMEKGMLNICSTPGDARYGRSGRRRHARARSFEAGRHGDAGRAVRARRTRQEPRQQSDGHAADGALTSICTPNSLSQEVKLGLGAQAGEARLKAVFEEAGFRGFRRAAETPMNLILEARA